MLYNQSRRANSRLIRNSWIIGVLCVLMALTAFSCIVPNAHADVTKNRKVISIVYDDSGSMLSEDKIANANYALQTLAALTDQEDELLITYMSDWENGAVKVDLNNIDQAVDKIRKKDNTGGDTPLESVETAADALMQVKDTDPETQYCLIVLSDGMMSRTTEKKGPKDIQKLLEDLSQRQMPNGTQMQISYMAIGNGAVEVDDSKIAGADSYKAPTSKDIMSVLSEISDKIAGRIRVDDADIKVVDDQTISVNSKLPLSSISILSQGKKSVVDSASTDSQKKLNINRNVSLNSPDYAKGKKLSGSVAVIDGDGDSIPAGKYTIRFSKPIDPDNLVIMYLPAVKIRIDISKDGKVVKNPAKLKNGDEIDISIYPVDAGTDKEIAANRFPSGINWKITYQIDDSVKGEADAQFLNGQTTEIGHNQIIGSIQFPNLAPIKGVVEFDIEKEPEYAVKVINERTPTYQRSHMGRKGSKECVKMVITADGVPVTKKEAEAIGLTIKNVSVEKEKGEKLLKLLNRFSNIEANTKIVMEDDGSFIVYPERAFLHSFLIIPGTYTVTVALQNNDTISAVGKYKIHASIGDWKDLLFLLILLAIILYMLYVLLIKHKFAGEMLVIDVIGEDVLNKGKKKEALSKSVKLHWYRQLLSPTPSSATVSGIKVYASSRSGGVFIKEVAIKASSKYGTSASDPINNYTAVLGSLIDTKAAMDRGNIPERVDLTNVPYYLVKGRYLYRITVE